MPTRSTSSPQTRRRTSTTGMPCTPCRCPELPAQSIPAVRCPLVGTISVSLALSTSQPLRHPFVLRVSVGEAAPARVSASARPTPRPLLTGRQAGRLAAAGGLGQEIADDSPASWRRCGCWWTDSRAGMRTGRRGNWKRTRSCGGRGRGLRSRALSVVSLPVGPPV
jgi:hypothetical protein